MRGEARQMLQGVLDLGRGGTFQSRTERDIVVRTSLARLDQLDIGDQALYFGRIDRVPEPGTEPPTAPWASRSTSAASPCPARTTSPWWSTGALRWRSPSTGRPGSIPRAWPGAATSPCEAGRCSGSRTSTSSIRPAGPKAPAGVDGTAGWRAPVVRRHGPRRARRAAFGARSGPHRPDGRHRGDDPARAGRDHPFAAGRACSSSRAVPAPGKTAVALHRAAYLLYTHRFPLERQGVLVVGPNPLFLRYIEQVLPSLGETGVSLSTVAGLVPEVRVRGDRRPRGRTAQGRRADGEGLGQGRPDPAAPAAPRRRGPLRRQRAAAAGRGRPRRSSRWPAGGPVPTTPAAALSRRKWSGELSDEYRARLERGGVTTADDGRAPKRSRTTWRSGCAGFPRCVEALDRMWPRLSPHELLHDLLGARPLLAAAGKGILNATEVQRSVPAAQRVARCRAVDRRRRRPDRRGPRPSSVRAGPPDPGAARAADEGTAQEAGSGPRAWPPRRLPHRRPSTGADDEIRSFGHIVVDEVQDLSPMQLRMLARRSLSGSMTVVGDIAQATGPWAPARLGRRHPRT